MTFKKYKTFSVLIHSYINTSGNWKNEKLCGNTTTAGQSVVTQFRVFPIFTSVDITVYQYGKNVFRDAGTGGAGGAAAPLAFCWEGQGGQLSFQGAFS